MASSPDPTSSCTRCGATGISPGLGSICPRCLLADVFTSEAGLGEDVEAPISAAPTFIRQFGDYELLGEIAQGGMGVIWRARQRSLGRVVAVKLMSAGEFARPEIVQRFRTEAAAAAKLQHPNIVAIHEVGEHEGLQYFSMDLVDGPNLAAQLSGQPLAPLAAARLVKTLADAIQYAHERGILHRDLKPSNVLIDPFGSPRITDFGLAKDVSSDADLTVTGQVLGTPGYLPPEQADPSRGPVGPASDVYSLGAILYFTLTGRAPFLGGSVHETLRQVLNDDPVAPRILNTGVPLDLETICLKCLERESTRRYPSAAALSAELGRFVEGLPILARPISAPERWVRWCRRRPAMATIWGLVIALAAGSTLAAALIQRAKSSTETALGKVTKAETQGRVRLRESLLSEARAVTLTTLPGRRRRALSALAEAARIKSGTDLRDAAFAALLQWDIDAGETSPTPEGGIVRFAPHGRVGVLDFPRFGEAPPQPARFLRWGSTQTVAELQSPALTLGSHRFSADGTRLIARHLDDSIHLWEFGTPKPFLILTNQPLSFDTSNDGDISDVDFSPDGTRFVSGRKDGGLIVRRASDGAELARWDVTNVFNQVRYSPDGKHIGAANFLNRVGREIRLLDSDLKPEGMVTLAAQTLMFSWSSDSHRIGAALTDGTVVVHNIEQGWATARINANLTADTATQFLGNDSLVAVRGLGSIFYLFNAAQGNLEIELNDMGRSPISPGPGGHEFVTTSVNEVSTRWKVVPPTGFRAIPNGRVEAVGWMLGGCCIDFSPDGAWLVSGHGRYTRIRDAVTGRVIDEQDSGVTGRTEWSMVALQDGGKTLIRISRATGITRHPIRMSPLGPRIGPGEILDSEPEFMMAAHTPDGRRLALISSFAEPTPEVRIVEVTDRGLLPLSRWKAPGVGYVAFNVDGTQVLVNGAEEASVRVHRVDDGSVIRTLDVSPKWIATWSANGAVAMTSNGADTSIVWDPITWKPRLELKGELAGSETTFDLSPDGSEAVVARNRRIYVISTRDGRVLSSFESPKAGGNPVSLRYLPDGKRFSVLWGEGRVDIFDPAALEAAAQELGIQ